MFELVRQRARYLAEYEIPGRQYCCKIAKAVAAAAFVALVLEVAELLYHAMS